MSKTYVLKDGTLVEAIPIGKAKMKIGDISPDGYLEICDRIPNNPGNRAARIVCKCKCGNYTATTASAFYSGLIKSCGCYNIEQKKILCSKLGKKSYFKDYSLVKNPFYTFLEATNKSDKDGSLYWKIKCNKCGKIYEAMPSQLISEKRRRGSNPCECWRATSKGVLKIKNILDKNNIEYTTEKTFPDCLSPKGNCLKFDFYIKNKYLIEYDGEQHFIPTNFHNNDYENKIERFNKNKEYDTIKNNYCIANNILLIRIPYTRYNDLILDDLLEHSEFSIMKKEGE